MLLRGRSLDLGDPLEEQAPTLASFEAQCEERTIQAVRDRTSFGQDLDFLCVGPDEVEDPMVVSLSVFDERGECRDGLSGTRWRVDEEDPSALPQLGDLAENLVLSRPDPVREEVGGFGDGGWRRRTLLSFPSTTRERDLRVSLQWKVRRRREARKSYP